MYCGLHHLAHNTRIPRGSVQLQQTNGDLILVAVHTVSCGEHITIIDQRTTAEETRIVATLDELSGPGIFVGAHLSAAHNAIDIGLTTDWSEGGKGRKGDKERLAVDTEDHLESSFYSQQFALVVQAVRLALPS